MRSGNWRIIFDRDDQILEIEVSRIGSRSDAYKKKENKLTKMKVILDDKGQPASAVVPWRLFKRLSEFDSELDSSDEELYDSAESADEESFPIDVANVCQLANPLSRFTAFIAE